MCQVAITTLQAAPCSQLPGWRSASGLFALVPIPVGVAVMALAWGSRSARWLHLRVHQKEGERPKNIAISLPLPLHLIAWLLRHFGSYIPNLDATGLDEVV
jgi:hypothetical protein